MPVVSPPGKGPVSPTYFNVPVEAYTSYRLSGVTRDATGAPLGNCTVHVFESASKLYRATTTADGAGNYAVAVDGPATGLQFVAVAIDPTGLLVGVTLFNLVGS